jgi:hypothetical protein
MARSVYFLPISSEFYLKNSYKIDGGGEICGGV